MGSGCGGADGVSPSGERWHEGGFGLASTSGNRDASTRLAQPATLGWALRRAALGLFVLFVAVTFGAWLLWASIDPDDASAADGPDNSAVEMPAHH